MLSLIIPTNNRSHVLKSLLLALKKQIGSFEVIIVDDASIDSTGEMIKAIGPSLPYNLTYIKLKYQLGLPRARNVGLKYSNYDLVGYLDDDCLPIRKDLLDRASKWLRLKNQNIIGVGGPVFTKSIESNIKLSKIGFKDLFKIKPMGRLFLNYIEIFYFKPLKLRYINSLPGGNCFFRKNFVKKCNGFDPKFDGNFYREETDLCRKIRAYGYLVSDPNMPVNHLQVSYGGCRRSAEEFYSNVFSNTIFFCLKHKRISIEVFLDTFKHLITSIYTLITGLDKGVFPVKRVSLLKRLIQSFGLGLAKYYNPKRNFYPEIVNLKLVFKIIKEDFN